MKCDCIFEPERVAKISDEGIGVDPAIPVRQVDSMTDRGRAMTATDYTDTYICGGSGNSSAGSAGSSGGSGILVVNAAEDSGAMNKTWQEIANADYAVFVTERENIKDFYFLRSLIIDDDSYVVSFMNSDYTYFFTTDIASGYPVYDPNYGADDGVEA